MLGIKLGHHSWYSEPKITSLSNHGSGTNNRMKNPYETIKSHEQNFINTGEKRSKMENDFDELHQTMASINQKIEYLMRKSKETGSNGGNVDRAKGSENAKARQETYTPPHLKNQSNQQNSVSIADKVDFPEFNGENPQEWIRKANRFFELNPKENRKVLHAGYYMIDTADTWYTEYVEGRAEVEWETFCEMLLQRFLYPGGEKWTSTVAVVPVLAASTHPSIQLIGRSTQSSPIAVVSDTTTHLNMAKIVAQGPSRAQITYPSSVGTQVLEERVSKQSRQLIPGTQALPKTLVGNTADKLKNKLGQHHPSISSSLPITHSPCGATMNDSVSKTLNGRKLNVLQPAVREKIGFSQKDTSSPTNGTPVLGTKEQSYKPSDRKPELNVLEKRPTPQALSRNDFFNQIRKKSMNSSSASDLAISNSSSSTDKVKEREVVLASSTLQAGGTQLSEGASEDHLSDKIDDMACKNEDSQGKKHSSADHVLSELQHINIVPRIGYGKERREMILGYEHRYPGGAALTSPIDIEVVERSNQGVVEDIENSEKKFYGLQYQPEVTHAAEGTMEYVLEEELKIIKESVAPEEHGICVLSGGVDSTAAGTLVHKVIGDRLHCIFVDNGLLRWKERERVMEAIENDLHLPVACVDASEQFLSKLKVACNDWQNTGSTTDVQFFLVSISSNSVVTIRHLSDFEACQRDGHKVLFGFYDPCHLPNNPGYSWGKDIAYVLFKTRGAGKTMHLELETSRFIVWDPGGGKFLFAN